jgi:hypothetical protein
MSDYGTIKIPREEYERHNKRRKELAESWAAYIDGQSPDLPNDAEDVATRIVEQIGADVGGPQVDDTEIARAVARELDYAHLADKVSEQVVREIKTQR